MEDNKHTMRLMVALTAIVLVLFAAALNLFMEDGATEGQQAAVLRAYAE